MHGPIKIRSPDNTSKWQMGFNSAFKGLNAELNPICHLLVLLGAHHILHISRIKVKEYMINTTTSYEIFYSLDATKPCGFKQAYL
jgi:hypothetical protein